MTVIVIFMSCYIRIRSMPVTPMRRSLTGTITTRRTQSDILDCQRKTARAMTNRPQPRRLENCMERCCWFTAQATITSTFINQRLNHLNAVLKVDVIVACAVNQQQRSMQFSSRLGCGRFVIALAVFLWQSKISLCVRRVVIVPVSDRRNGDSGFEHIRMCHGIKSHVTAITPSPDRNVVTIELGKLRQQLIQCRELVV